MTSIDFYTGCSDPVGVAARLVAKAWAQYGSVRVMTADEEGTAVLDSLLWRVPATGFLPHCRLSSRLARETPILVDHAAVHEGPCAVLVNLHRDSPPFFARFERLAEIVGADTGDVEAGRRRWQYYRERGYELRSHDLSERV